MKALQKKIHALAVKNGWWESPRSPLEVHMLIVSEVAEATEAVRAGLHPMGFATATLAGTVLCLRKT